MSKITVKGAPASSEQKRILRRALELADRWGAPYKAKVALIEALIVESEAKNLSSSSADGYGSYGVLQGRDIYHKRSDLMDPDYQIGVFLGKGRGGKKNPKGFTGKGNAISLSKSGMKSGDIAQAIEGSAYPDRYMQHQREAMRIVRELGRGESKSSGVAPSKVSRSGVAVEDPALRQAALQQYLSQRKKPGALLALASGLDDAVSLQQPAGDVSGASQTNPRKKKGNGPTARSAKAQGLSPLLELFWQGEGGINADNGKKVPQGYVPGHTDHVHVAAGPKTLNRLDRRAKDFGLRVSSADRPGAITSSGNTSFHAVGKARDYAGSAKQMRSFAQYIARLYGVEK